MYADYLDPTIDSASRAAAGTFDDKVGPARAVMDPDRYHVPFRDIRYIDPTEVDDVVCARCAVGAIQGAGSVVEQRSPPTGTWSYVSQWT